jgi:hypothetical protein
MELMKKKSLAQCLNLFVLFLLIFWFSNQINISANSKQLFVKGCDFNPYSNLVTLNTFPVDLDLLYWNDNLTNRNHNLNLLGNGSNGWIIPPWGGHFTTVHHEGQDKFYLYANRYLEVVAPHDGQIVVEQVSGDITTTQIKGNDVVVDYTIHINIGQDCSLKFGHILLLESIYDELQITDSYAVTEGELVGYTPGENALDFHYLYGKYDQNLCPYTALSTNLQVKLGYYHTLEYQRAIIGGTHPESHICVPLEVSIENTVWGVWQYNTGPYGSFYDGKDTLELYQPGFLTIFSRDFANDETFYKNPIDNTKNLTEDTIGILTDGSTMTDIPEYTSMGKCLIELVQGDSSDGIFELFTVCISEWGPINTSLFAKFSIIEGKEGSNDDFLEIEYFNNLIDAQAGFTSDKITYDRFHENYYLNRGNLGYQPIISVIFFLEIIVAVIIIRKRKSSQSIN